MKCISWSEYIPKEQVGLQNRTVDRMQKCGIRLLTKRETVFNGFETICLTFYGTKFSFIKFYVKDYLIGNIENIRRLFGYVIRITKQK